MRKRTLPIISAPDASSLFDEQLRKHQLVFFRFASRYAPADAFIDYRDIVFQAAANVWGKAQCDPNILNNFRNYCFSAIYNECVNVKRLLSRRPDAMREADLPEGARLPEGSAVDDPGASYLYELIAQLAPKLRAVLELQAAGYGRQEICRELKLTKTSGHRLIVDAREAFAELLRANGYPDPA